MVYLFKKGTYHFRAESRDKEIHSFRAESKQRVAISLRRLIFLRRVMYTLGRRADTVQRRGL